MSTFDFYGYLNSYTPELQAKALRLAQDDMDLARQLYLRTATRAMQLANDRFSERNVEFFVDNLMLEVLDEMKTEQV